MYPNGSLRSESGSGYPLGVSLCMYSSSSWYESDDNLTREGLLI